MGLKKHQFAKVLPASALAQAFTTTSVQSLIGTNTANYTAFSALTDSQKFMANYGIGLASIASSIAGSVAGAKLFQALGLPSTAGSVVGGAVSQQAVKQIIDYAAGNTATTSVAAGANGLLSFGNALSSAGGAAIGSYLGLDASKLIIGDLNNGATFGGAVGSAVGAYFGVSAASSSAALSAFGTTESAVLGGVILPGAGALVGAAVGTILGSLFGSLFGPGASVGPNADASVAYNGAQWYLYASSADNGGSVVVAQQLAQAAIGELNGLASAIGGHLVTNAGGFGLGYFASRGYYYNFQINGQNNLVYAGSTQTTVDNAVIKTVHNEAAQGGIQGGDPFMEYAYAHSAATTASGLISDLNAAHDYGLYLANPLAFDASLAMSGSQAQLTMWAQEINQAQALGLGTAPSTTDLSGTALSETGGYVASHLEILEDFRTSQMLTGITLTDNVLAISANQLSHYNGLLSLISQSNRNAITISDTNANISANLATINAYITGNRVASVNATDSVSSYINNTPLTLAAGVNQTVTGRGNSINLNSNDTLTLNTIGTGGNVVNGGGGVGDTVYFYGNVSQTAGAVIDRVNLNNGIVEAGANACLNVFGYGNSIIENDNVTLSIFGNNNGIQGADGQTIYNDLSGGYNISVGNYSTINITGNGVNASNGGLDVVTLWNGKVNVMPSAGNVVGADININGGNNLVTLYSKDNIIATGGNNTINSSGLGNSVTVNGNGAHGENGGVDTINMFNVGLHIMGASSVVINGYANGVYIEAGDTVTINSTNTGASIINAANGDTINFSGNASMVTGGVIDVINGSGDAINAAASACYNVYGSNDSVTNGTNATATVFGSNNNIVEGTGDTLYLGLGGGNAITAGSGSRLYVTGNGSTGANGGVDTIAASGSAIALTTSPTSVTGADVNITGSSNTVTCTANDTVVINGSSNIIAGTSGDSFTETGGGMDKYAFGRGTGAQTITKNAASGLGANGELDVGAGVATNQLWFQRNGNNLLAEIIGTQDRVTVVNWYTNASSEFAEIKTSDGNMIDTQFNQLVQAMATYSGSSAFNPVTATQFPADATLQNTLANAWHH